MDTAPSTRDLILDAAEQLFGSQGYAKVTINQICEASRLPVGSVYYHFGNKAGVLSAVLERGTVEIFADLSAADDQAGPPLERLAAFYRTAADLIAKRLPMYRLLASLQLHQPGSDEIKVILRESVQRAQARVVISHLKCTGIDHWGGSGALLNSLDAVSDEAAGWDCYPYAASSSTLDLKQVDERVKIAITWSTPHPEMAGNTLEEIAQAWSVAEALRSFVKLSGSA